MKKFLLLLVFASTVGLSTFARNNVNTTNSITSADSIMLKKLENELRAFDEKDDHIKFTNITSKISKKINEKNQVECTITFSMEAEASLFGSGVKMGVSCSFTAANCLDAGKGAMAGLLSQVAAFKAMISGIATAVMAVLDAVF